MEECSKPYLKMLAAWIYEGLFNDPYEEFMISQTAEEELPSQTHKSIRNYWDKKFILKNRNTLCLLCGLEDKILASGKYIHLLKTLKKFRSHNDDKDLIEDKLYQSPPLNIISFKSTSNFYAELIENNYLKISSELFQFLMKEEKILEKLT